MSVFPLALVNIIRFMIQGMGFGVLAIMAGVFEMVARTLAARPYCSAPGFCYLFPVIYPVTPIILSSLRRTEIYAGIRNASANSQARGLATVCSMIWQRPPLCIRESAVRFTDRFPISFLRIKGAAFP